MSWFSVDKSGLAAILERRGKAFALFELCQNSYDSETDRLRISLEPLPGAPYARLEVEDWGTGFVDLEHAYTMFARSERASDPVKRGRFNLGEKLVLSICRKAHIVTTKGSLTFDTERRQGGDRREKGTLFEAEIRMTRVEYDEVCRAVRRIIPPVPTTFNGNLIEPPALVCRFETKLPTEWADMEGVIHRSVRLSSVEVYEAGEGDGEVLELGIPVVEAEFPYKANVLAKVPLGLDRDSVTPAFMKALQAALLNHVHEQLGAEEAAKPWVQEAVGDARATPDAVKDVIAKRFGEHAVVATPGDVLANSAAARAGYTVVHGGALSPEVWANVRKMGILPAAATVFPSPKPEQVAAVNKALEGKCPACGK
jgi:hypothetical protein